MVLNICDLDVNSDTRKAFDSKIRKLIKINSLDEIPRRFRKYLAERGENVFRDYNVMFAPHPFLDNELAIGKVKLIEYVSLDNEKYLIITNRRGLFRPYGN